MLYGGSGYLDMGRGRRRRALQRECLVVENA